MCNNFPLNAVPERILGRVRATQKQEALFSIKVAAICILLLPFSNSSTNSCQKKGPHISYYKVHVSGQEQSRLVEQKLHPYIPVTCG